MLCDICHKESGRRRTRIGDKLVCFDCHWANTQITRGDPDNYLKESYSRECKANRELRERVAQLEAAQYPVAHEAKKHPYTNAVSALPPVEVLEKAILALDEYRYFNNFAEVLGDYYGIVAPKYLASDEKTPKDANAAYFWETNTVYAPKSKALKYHTAFHEMWHALERHGIVPHGKDSEIDAQRYAKLCLRKLGRSENS